MDGGRDGVPPLTVGPETSRYVDLHAHSTASDGERAPAAVADAAHRAGLAAIALTDHDTLDGVPEMLHAASRIGLRVISGCEFSVQAPWGEMHLLGYFLPPDALSLNQFLIDARAGRRERGRKMISRLQALGVSVSFDELLEAAGGGAVGRPHVARALFRGGHVNSVNDAFDRYLGRGRPAYVEKELPTLRAVADLVHGVGGVVSAAHLKDRGTRPVLRRFKEDGLDAVETRHPAHDGDQRARLTALALELGLRRTGGSDWHGEDDTIGSHGFLGSQDVPVEWLDQLEAARPAVKAPGEASTGGVS